MELLDWARKHRDYSFTFAPAKGVIKGPSAQLIWFYLRWNPAFQKDVDSTLREIEGLDSKEELSADNLESAVAARWGLTEFINYKASFLPAGVGFRIFVADLLNLAAPFGLQHQIDAAQLRSQSTAHLNNPFAPHPLMAFVINPFLDEKLIFAHIKNLLDGMRKTNPSNLKTLADFQPLKGSAVGRLIEYVVCHHLSNVCKKRPKEIKAAYVDTLGHVSLQDHQIKEKVQRFNVYARSAPWIFFAPPNR